MRLISFLLVAPVWAAPSDLEMARDRQDRAALEKLAEQAGLFACALGRCHHPWHGTGTASSAPHQVQLESRAS